jgi:acyl transferase domain-containing protein
MTTESFDQLPVAIVGMACRLPGATDLDELWRLLIEGRSMTQRLPAERLDRELYFDPRRGVLGKSYSEVACLVDYRPPRREACPLPDTLADCPEITYTTLCEVAAEACHHAGWDPRDLPYRNVGVYVGHTRKSGYVGDQIYAAWIKEAAPLLLNSRSFQSAAGRDAAGVIREVVSKAEARARGKSWPSIELGSSVAASLISRAFELNGPCMVFNSACASSMNAVLHGVRSLQRGKIDVALVGGASYCHHDTMILFSQAQSLSATGTRPFDEAADGLIVGEGYVVLALKTLGRADVDVDRVFVFIR